MSAAVDTSAFDAAFRQYLAKTSKTMEEAIAWKSGDLMLQAAKHTPKSASNESAFKAQMRSRPLIAYRTRRRFGKITAENFETVQNQMANSRLGKGFMRSAFVKAFAKIPRTKKSTGGRAKDLEASRLTKSTATVTVTTGQVKSIFAALTWQAKGGNDQSLKQDIVDSSMAKAFPAVTRSMIAYLTGENVKNAKSVSA